MIVLAQIRLATLHGRISAPVSGSKKEQTYLKCLRQAQTDKQKKNPSKWKGSLPTTITITIHSCNR